MRAVPRSRLCRESPLTPGQAPHTRGSRWGWHLHPHRLPHGECGVWGGAPGGRANMRLRWPWAACSRHSDSPLIVERSAQNIARRNTNNRHATRGGPACRSSTVQSCPRRRAFVACDERTTDAVGNSCQTLRKAGERPQIVRKNRISYPPNPAAATARLGHRGGVRRFGQARHAAAQRRALRPLLLRRPQLRAGAVQRRVVHASTGGLRPGPPGCRQLSSLVE